MNHQPPETPPSAPDDFEESFASALGEAHKRKRAENNWEAIQAWNEWVAENGLTLEEYLRRIDRRGRGGRE